MLDDDLRDFREIAVELREALWRDPFCRKKFSLLFLVDMLLAGRTTEEAIDLGYDVIDGVEHTQAYFVFNQVYEDFRDFVKIAIVHHKPDWSFTDMYTDWDDL